MGTGQPRLADVGRRWLRRPEAGKGWQRLAKAGRGWPEAWGQLEAALGSLISATAAEPCWTLSSPQASAGASDAPGLVRCPAEQLDYISRKLGGISDHLVAPLQSFGENVEAPSLYIYPMWAGRVQVRA